MVERKVAIKIPCSVNVRVDNFQITLDEQQVSQGTILDFKTKLSEEHPCRPSLEDQRLVWRGRLLADQEPISILFADPTTFDLDSCATVHLVLKTGRYVVDNSQSNSSYERSSNETNLSNNQNSTSNESSSNSIVGVGHGNIENRNINSINPTIESNGVGTQNDDSTTGTATATATKIEYLLIDGIPYRLALTGSDPRALNLVPVMGAIHIASAAAAIANTSITFRFRNNGNDNVNENPNVVTNGASAAARRRIPLSASAISGQISNLFQSMLRSSVFLLTLSLKLMLIALVLSNNPSWPRIFLVAFIALLVYSRIWNRLAQQILYPNPETPIINENPNPETPIINENPNPETPIINENPNPEIPINQNNTFDNQNFQLHNIPIQQQQSLARRFVSEIFSFIASFIASLFPTENNNTNNNNNNNNPNNNNANNANGFVENAPAFNL